MSFLITLTKTLAKDELAPHLEPILVAIVNWKPETRNPFRLKVRRLLERLVKKFGFRCIKAEMFELFTVNLAKAIYKTY